VEVVGAELAHLQALDMSMGSDTELALPNEYQVRSSANRHHIRPTSQST